MIFKKSKRGMVLIFMLGLLFCFLIMPMLFVRLETKKFQFERKLGDIQLDTMNTYQTADKVLFYIDESARYAANQAIFDLGLNGGHAQGCEEYKGFPLWVTEQGDCYPEQEKNLVVFLEKYLDEYFVAYPDGTLIGQSENYDFLVEQKEKLVVTGIATRNIEFDIEGRREKEEEKRTELVVTRPGIDVSYYYYYTKLDSRLRPSNTAVDRVILHHTGGPTFESGYAALKRGGKSSHYMIDRDGTIYYLIDESRLAYHAKDWNSRSIGIEIVNTGDASMKYTDAQFISITNLINDIVERWDSISVDDEHIIAHYQASDTGKWDPSPNFVWARIGLPQHTTLYDLGRRPPEEAGYENT